MILKQNHPSDYKTRIKSFETELNVLVNDTRPKMFIKYETNCAICGRRILTTKNTVSEGLCESCRMVV